MWYLTQYYSKKSPVSVALEQVGKNSTLAQISINSLIGVFTNFKSDYQTLLKVNNYSVWKKLYLSNFNTWNMEVLLRFGINNNYVIFNTPVVPDIVLYRNYLMDERNMKTFNRKTHSEMIFGFTTGRCGFSRNQKRSFLAIEITMRATVWFCKQMHKFLNGVKIRFLGSSKKILRHLHHFKRFNLGKKRVQLHSIIDVTPTPYNGVRQKMRGRKRYRYHKYTFKRFVKMFNRVQMAQPIFPKSKNR